MSNTKRGSSAASQEERQINRVFELAGARAKTKEAEKNEATRHIEIQPSTLEIPRVSVQTTVQPSPQSPYPYPFVYQPTALPEQQQQRLHPFPTGFIGAPYGMQPEAFGSYFPSFLSGKGFSSEMMPCFWGMSPMSRLYQQPPQAAAQQQQAPARDAARELEFSSKNIENIFSSKSVPSMMNLSSTSIPTVSMADSENCIRIPKSNASRQDSLKFIPSFNDLPDPQIALSQFSERESPRLLPQPLRQGQLGSSEGIVIKPEPNTKGFEPIQV